MTKYAEHYREVENDLRMLLADLRRDLSPSETKEVTGFIEVREYGLALETLSAIIVEEDKFVDGHIVSAVERLAEKMEFENSSSVADLRAFLKSKQGPSFVLG